MNTFPSNAQATRLAFDENSFTVYLADGRILNVPLAFFPRLLNADQGQREHYELSGGGTGIHWDDLDEDLSVEGLLLGISTERAATWNHLRNPRRPWANKPWCVT